MEDYERLRKVKLKDALQPPIDEIAFEHASLATRILLARCVNTTWSNVPGIATSVILDMEIQDPLKAALALRQFENEVRTL